jgi:hypothetical protein
MTCTLNRVGERLAVVPCNLVAVAYSYRLQNSGLDVHLYCPGLPDADRTSKLYEPSVKVLTLRSAKTSNHFGRLR